MSTVQPGTSQPAPAPPQARVTATADPATTIDIVDALRRNAGNPKGQRASFAKGQCVVGSYTPARGVERIIASPSFTEPSTLLGRFAVGGGNPAISDTNRTVLRGFSFRLGPAGYSTDLLLESAPVHFARSTAQMLGFLQARSPGPDGKPDPERIKAFSAANPETTHQASYLAARPLPASFAGVAYWGVHAFPATAADGSTRYVKFKAVPVDGEAALTDEQAAARPDDFLAAELIERIATGSARFQLMAILDRPGDPVMDVTLRWPQEDDREAACLGTITLSGFEDNLACDQSIFNPGNLAGGLGRPPDEMFAARLLAYVVSLDRRRDRQG